MEQIFVEIFQSLQIKAHIYHTCTFVNIKKGKLICVDILNGQELGKGLADFCPVVKFNKTASSNPLIFLLSKKGKKEKKNKGKKEIF